MDSKNVKRSSLGLAFFVSGLSFATWASRIPTIKDIFTLNEAELGNILMVLPISSLIGLPVSGWLVSKLESRIPLFFSTILSTISLICVAYSTSLFSLVVAVAIFAFFLRIQIIAINTQAIILQKSYRKNINGSFHGLWSTGGIFGILFSTLMIKQGISIEIHFFAIGVFILLSIFICYPFLLTKDKSLEGNRLKFGKPDILIFSLGMLAFLASICEGGMYDWSGIYFKEVIKEEIFTLGFLTFVISMTISRFSSDYFVGYFGVGRTYIIYGILIISGFLIAILFPFFLVSLIGFCLVGFGVAGIVPITYTLVGTSKKYSVGMAISIVSTYGMAGVFLGPPLIGYLAQAFGLKTSFISFILFGFLVIPFSKLFLINRKRMLNQ